MHTIYNIKMITLTNVTLEILSAILLALAIPNEFITFGSPLLGILALIPHFIALDRSKSLKESCGLCFIQSCLTHILSSFWLSNFKDFAIFTLGASALGTGGIHAFFGLFFYLPRFYEKKVLSSPLEGSKISRFIKSNSFRAFWFASVYTLWEYVKCTGFLAYPWGTIHMTFYKLKSFCQIVDITGVRGITFFISYLSAILALLFMDSIKSSVKNSFILNKNIIFSVLSIFLLVEAYGIIQFSKDRKPLKYINTVLIQQNIDSWATKGDNISIEISQDLTQKGIKEFKNQGIRPDLIVWSEAILHYPFPEAMNYYSVQPKSYPLIKYIRDTNIPTIIGAPYSVDFDKGMFSNSVIIFNKDGNLQGNYAKIHLVPFAEHIPFTEYEFIRNLLDTLVGFSSGWEAGKEFKVFEIPTKDNSVKISTPICFEDAFADICRGLKKLGTELFVNVSDDSWSLTKSAEYQHFVIAWFRAIEFRTTLLRSTNAGYTVVITPNGEIIADLPLFTRNYLNCSVPIYENISTTYMLFGEWIVLIIFLFIFASLIFIITSKFKPNKKIISKKN